MMKIWLFLIAGMLSVIKAVTVSDELVAAVYTGIFVVNMGFASVLLQFLEVRVALSDSAGVNFLEGVHDSNTGSKSHRTEI